MAVADEGWTLAGELQVFGGTEGVDWQVKWEARTDPNGRNISWMNILHIMGSTPVTVKNAIGAAESTTAIEIDAGAKADLTLAGVSIKTKWIPLNITTNTYGTESGERATEGSQIPEEKQTSLHLTLADNTENALTTTGYFAALRCGEGSQLTIDDAIRNIDTEGNPVVPEKGRIAETVTLDCGKVIEAGSGTSALDSDNPGSLTAVNGDNGAGIGGSGAEAGGTMTFNGGHITAGKAQANSSAGIGGGGYGSGTKTFITFNSGTYNAIGAAHGAGIGAGGWGSAYSDTPTHPKDYILDNFARKRGTPVGGNILVNGGYIIATGGYHGAGFGGACSLNPSIADCVIRITGGTILPKGAGLTADKVWLPDLGGEDGHVIIEGGSVYVSQQKAFIGIGDTAWGNDQCLADGYDPSDPDDPNKVFMVTVDLSADGVDTEPIDNWQLTVGGVPYDYGAPTYFDKGKLYLWLPKEAADKVIDADFSYTRTLEDGTQETVTPTTMYRDPHSPADPDDPNRTKLKRYVEFELDPDYEASLEKYYDGLPFDPYT